MYRACPGCLHYDPCLSSSYYPARGRGLCEPCHGTGGRSHKGMMRATSRLTTCVIARPLPHRVLTLDARQFSRCSNRFHLLARFQRNRESESCCHQSQNPAGNEGVLIVAELGVNPTACNRSQGTADLVKNEGQSKNSADRGVAKNLGYDRHGPRPRRKPVKTVNHGENQKAGSIANER